MENAEKYPIDESVLIRHLIKQTDSEENRAIELWLLQNTENQKLYADLSKIWENSFAIKAPLPKVNVDSAWEKMQAKMKSTTSAKEAQETKVIALKPKNSPQSIFKVWQIAASIVLLVGMTWVISTLFNNESTDNQVFATTNKTSELNLADGTRVFLNRKSKLTYPKTFDKNVRQVEFSGEAFFEVKSNLAQPFQIKTDLFEVEVLGTAFNVNVSDNGGNVIVKEGKVRVKSGQNELILTAGEQAIYNPQTQSLEKSKPKNENYLAYKTKILNFKDTPLPEAIKQISELYQVEVELTYEKLKNRTITVKFDNKDLETVLFGVTFPFEQDSLEYKKEGGKIILRKKSGN